MVSGIDKESDLRYHRSSMRELDDRAFLTKYDREGMIFVLDRFVDQCKEAIETGERFDFPVIEGIDQIIVCGMGGSAMAGEIAKRFAQIPLFVNRSYDLPVFIDRHTLLVAISYSGNTAETLSSLDQGIGRCGYRALGDSSPGARSGQGSVHCHRSHRGEPRQTARPHLKRSDPVDLWNRR